MNKQRLSISLAVMVACSGIGSIQLDLLRADTPQSAPMITISPETTAITKPLLPDGMPDYIKALNDKYSAGVTPENNAFVAWLELIGTEKVLSTKTKSQMLAMCGARDSGEKHWLRYDEFFTPVGKSFNDHLDDEEIAGKRLWSPADFPELAEYLKAKGSVLDATKEAFSRSRYWMPYVSQDQRTLNSVLIPSLGRYRDVGNNLCARAMLRAAAGDYDGFRSDVMACKQMARKISYPCTIERLVGIAIDVTATRAISAVAGSGMLSAEQISLLQSELARLDPLPTVRDMLHVNERWGVLDVAILVSQGKARGIIDDWRSAMDSGFTNGPNPEGIHNENSPSILLEINPSEVDWDITLRQINRSIDTYIAAAELPTMEEYERVIEKIYRDKNQKIVKEIMKTGWGKMRPHESREDYSNRIGEGFVCLLMWGPDSSEKPYRRMLLQSQMLDVVLAAAKYKAKTGQWPENLNKLVPDYLAAVPKDIYSKNGATDVQSSFDERGFRVISVGNNGKEFLVGAGRDGK